MSETTTVRADAGTDAGFARTVLDPMTRRRPLTEEQAAAAMSAIVGGQVPPVQATAFALALATRGETVDELVGLARAVRETGLEVPYTGDVLDTCGTGGDGLDTFNISTAAAVVAAAAGAVVAKHGNRSVSSSCGSADVLVRLGVRIDADPDTAARCLRETGVGFLFAPVFHPGFRHVAASRRELGVRTTFNLLGPLCNPARPRFQVLGVPRAELVAPMAEVLHRLGVVRAMVVHAEDGMDELSTVAPSRVVELRDGRRHEYRVDPRRYGLPPASPADLRGGDADDNARLLASVIDGEPGPRRDVVVLNTAAALYVAGRAGDLIEGMTRAREAIDGGAARRTLDAWVHAGRAEPVVTS